MAGWLGNRAWQAAVILLLTVMISLNLRILISVQYGTEDELPDDGPPSDPQCRGFLKYVGAARVHAMNASEVLFEWTTFSSNQARVLGHHRKQRGFLTIGVPSIKRLTGMTYLRQTLTSIIKETTARDKTEIVVVVFLADFDTTYNELVLADILKNFIEYINMGFIQVVQASRDFYPPLSQLKRNFNDKPDRVKWRAKQVSDFAFMFLYARNLSQYYLQLEDDVVCAPTFVASIRDFIKRHNNAWAVLEFSELGFIGKLFRARDLQKLAQFMMTFYDEQPIDWLIRYYRMAMAQAKVYLRKPTLFQHIGTTSSFDTSKANKLKDRFFDTRQKKWRGDDPDAEVFSSMQTYENNGPELCYGTGSGHFWAVSPRKDQAVTVVFERPELLTKVAVESGSSSHPTDLLQEAVLEASPKLLSIYSNGTVSCSDYKYLGKVMAGRMVADGLEQVLHGEKTKCLRLRVTKDQKDWAVIDQIAVFVKETNTFSQTVS